MPPIPSISTIATLAILLPSLAPAQVWHQRSPTVSPPSRHDHGAAWDPLRSELVCFGGSTSSFSMLNDQWTFDGTTWSPQPLTAAPSARARHGMVFDEARGRLVLFGGTDSSSQQLGDTWEWDGAAWARMSPPFSPSPRQGIVLVYDAARGNIVTFGGHSTQAPHILRDTWIYDGVTWNLASPAQEPPARGLYSACYDSRRDRVVLHGGMDTSTNFLRDTWEWDGSNWSPAVATVQPQPFVGATMTFDGRRGVVVLSGLQLTIVPQQNDVWEYDGVDWRPASSGPASLTGRSGHSLTYDRDRGTVVAFGGRKRTGFGSMSLDETWELGERASYTALGSGCATVNGQPTLSSAAPPRIGRTSTITIGGLGPNEFAVLLAGVDATSWGGTPLPADLAPLGLPGCSLYVRPDHALVLPAIGGAASAPLPIPLAHSLLGVEFWNQALVLEPTLPTGWAGSTAARHAVVGS